MRTLLETLADATVQLGQAADLVADFGGDDTKHRLAARRVALLVLEEAKVHAERHGAIITIMVTEPA